MEQTSSPISTFQHNNPHSVNEQRGREEEEAPLEDLRIRRNRLTQERHAARFEEQCATDASLWAAQRAACSNAQIMMDAS